MAQDLTGRTDADAMHLIGSIIDLGCDEQSLAALDHASSLLDKFGSSSTTDEDHCRAHYFRANIWSARRHATPDWQEWHWKSEAIDGEILELRRAVNHPGFSSLHLMAKAQIYTNLANVLNHTGRFIEAIEVWDRALALIPRFAMALGNRGIGLAHYAGAVYDGGHHGVLMVNACVSLALACEPDAIQDSDGNGAAMAQFQQRMQAIWDSYDIPTLTDSYEPDGHSLGRSKRERDYRQWCLGRRLFINPLNDVGPNSIAGRDILTLPTITTGFDEGPRPPAIIHYFNIIKQEYCTARYALYEGMTAEGVHFSDRGVLLYNTLDYPAVGLAVERMKMAFRGAYAMFDKIAFLLNAYFKLGHNERQVNFRNLWFVKGKGKTLHPTLDGMANWPLRGLFWLSKDIFEDDFREVTEPDAQALYELRNHLEHKFVSVHDGFSRAISPFQATTPTSGIFDISTDDLATKTLRQLKLARAAIIYLSLAVHAEERRRVRESSSEKLSMPMILDVWEDRWKRRF
jgi:tetratricopeptide (TPR) repeat protein